ncbi:hypothetical protein [Amorphus sp. 3PC139-8]|uniref:hypothetical protein n=1 Tax=Amorphus sp. 3PC139-8 TaxID=2735676 RepID=UPI00345CD3F2
MRMDFLPFPGARTIKCASEFLNLIGSALSAAGDAHSMDRLDGEQVILEKNDNIPISMDERFRRRADRKIVNICFIK